MLRRLLTSGHKQSDPLPHTKRPAPKPDTAAMHSVRPCDAISPRSRRQVAPRARNSAQGLAIELAPRVVESQAPPVRSTSVQSAWAVPTLPVTAAIRDATTPTFDLPMKQRSASTPDFLEKHFTPQYLAKRWGIHPTTVVRWARDREDVLRLGTPGRNGKRTRIELRIPASAAQRIYKERTGKTWG